MIVAIVLVAIVPAALSSRFCTTSAVSVTSCVGIQMQILRVISFIIERMQRQIRPHAAPLVQYLPQLWQESSEHNMLRCAILTTLTFLVQVRPLTPAP